jgi:catechol 2,3-dioxygenase-like lactoylglutathione lyase family enzyme
MKVLRRAILLAVLSVATLGMTAAWAVDWSHVHLLASDTTAAAEWYAKHFDGKAAKMGPMDIVAFGDKTILFSKGKEGFEGSVGSVLDHIGFSVPDVAAKMAELKAAGIKVVMDTREIKSADLTIAFVEDPWRTKIEILDDKDTLGFHHVHLEVADPEAAVEWFTKVLGAEDTGQYRNLLPCVRYGDIWVLISKPRGDVERVPSAGRSFDHFGVTYPDLDAAAEELKAKGVKFTLDPRPYGTAKIAFIEGPEGTKLELVQPPAR